MTESKGQPVRVPDDIVMVMKEPNSRYVNAIAGAFGLTSKQVAGIYAELLAASPPSAAPKGE